MKHYRIGRQRGFTLAELMISVTLGLLIIASMTTLFVRNNGAQAALENTSRQIENGRYAMQLISTDLRNSGFYAEFDPTVMAFPADVPDPCSVDMEDVKSSVKLHVQGVDDAAATDLSCLPDLKAGTDVLVVRHAEPCVVDSAGCSAADDGGPFIQASLCNSVAELNSDDPDTFFEVAESTGSMSLTRRDCSTVAAIRRMQVFIYYIATDNESGDGIPTLKRAELGAPDGSVVFTTVPLVEGIENLQIEYGLDTNADSVADAFVTSPAAYDGCATAECTNINWNNVVAARINLLARNTVATAGYTDTKSYTLGTLSDGSANVIDAANDAYKRHAFQALVSLPNPAGRKIP